MEKQNQKRKRKREREEEEKNNEKKMKWAEIKRRKTTNKQKKNFQHFDFLSCFENVFLSSFIVNSNDNTSI